MLYTRRSFVAFVLAVGAVLASAQQAEAQVSNQEWLCDPSTTDCRAPLLNLIASETVGIDVAFWFMEDSRFATALINRWRAGVPVRVLMDTKANTPYPNNVTMLRMLQDAGIPMRRMTSSYLHWKTMLFAGQNVVQFGSANYSPHAFVYQERLVDFLDETVYFTNDPAVVNSFKTKFDDAWVSTSRFASYANVTTALTRSYPVYTIDPELSFPPGSDFGTRSVARYNAEPATGGIDSIIYRITDRRHTDAIIAAHQRGVPIRIITEPLQYRDPVRYMHSWNVDRLFAAGVPLRHRSHLGANHQKTTLLHSQQMAIFGSQNWTTISGNAQYEHNYFTRRNWIYQWFRDQFERKWNSTSETEPFVPLPPDAPIYNAPATGAQVLSTQVTLRWNAGLWAHKYDIYFGTSSNPPLLAAGVELGNSTSSTDYVTYTVTGLTGNTTYYWRVVSRTMANMSRGGTVWNFRTGAPPQPGAGDVVLWAARAPTVRGRWTVTPDNSAAGGGRIGTADADVKVSSALASPASYFEMSFSAAAGVPYRLWLRGRAAGNSWPNDSAFVQFSDSVTSGGSAAWRIGTTSATTVTIEDCPSCGLSGWGWNDNATTTTPGALGTPVYFASSGTHTIRVQLREDGLSIDQIVISRDAFLSTAPGTTQNDGTVLPQAGGTSDGPPPPPPLPTGWLSRDVGAVGVPGSASSSNGTFTVRGAGADVWGTSDAFHFAYRAMSGDGTIVARVASIDGSEAWTKMGVMIRSSTSASAAHAFMIVSTGKGLAFQRRTVSGGTSAHTSGGTGTAPRWVRLSRAGNVITASVSSSGSTWAVVGSDTFSMPADVLVGIAAHSHTTSALATGRFDNVSVTAGSSTPPPPLPTGWQSRDVGAAGVAGSATASGGTFTVRGAGADVWGTADAFHYAYRSMSGDGSIVARVASISGTQAWTKIGVMIRGSTSSSSAHAFMLVSVGKGLAFQRRTADGALSTHTSGGTGTAPRWVRLVRTGTVITASVSTNGSTWTVVGSDTFSLPASVFVGLVAHSHTTTALASGVFDNVTVVQ